MPDMSMGVVDFGWQLITPLNGWVANTTPRTVNGTTYTPPEPAYRVSANFVFFQGELTAPGGLSIGSVMFQLPAEARRSNPAVNDYTIPLTGMSALAVLLPSAALLRTSGNVEYNGIVGGILGTLQNVYLNTMFYPR